MIAKLLMWFALKIGTVARWFCKHSGWDHKTVQGIHVRECQVCGVSERVRK